LCPRISLGTLAYMKNVIGFNLKYYRKERGFTLKDLSHQSGIKLVTLNAIERGRILNPSFTKIQAMASALGIPQDCLFAQPERPPSVFKGNLKGAVEFHYKKEGLNLISYTPLMKELFIGKGSLKRSCQIDFKHFPRLTFLFVEVIFGKLEVKWKTEEYFLAEGENLSLHSPQQRVMRNPYRTRDTSFLIISSPSLISANLESQTPLT